MNTLIRIFFGMATVSLSAWAQIPLITNQPAARVLWAGGNVKLSAGVAGGGPFTYQWQLNGTNLPNGLISTVAGGGVQDGGPATAASLNAYSVVKDTGGNLFIADGLNNRIRKVDMNGIITTVAGNSVPGYQGDGGPAVDASLNSPSGVAMDTAGNLFIADAQNYCIRKVDTSGIITTVAGPGQYGSVGDGAPADWAWLGFPVAVAVDVSGDLFISDSYLCRIRKVGPDGIINTVVGKSLSNAPNPGFSGDGGPAVNATLSHPEGITMDAAGDLLIADGGNNRIRRVDTHGIITTVAGSAQISLPNLGDGGAATNASLNLPYGVAVDASNNLYIADLNHYRVRKVDGNGVIFTVAGNGINNVDSGDGGQATNATVDPVSVFAYTAGNFLIAGAVVRQVDSNGYITTIAGNLAELSGDGGDGGPAINALLDQPAGLAIDAAGNLFISEDGHDLIRKVDTNGIISTIAGSGNSGFSGDNGPATNASFFAPGGLLTDGAGNLLVADTDNNCVREVDTNGVMATVVGDPYGFYHYSGDGGPATGAGLYLPEALAKDPAGDLFIADNHNHVVREVNTAGIIKTMVGIHTATYSGDGGPASAAGLNGPSGLAFDAAGNLFIADGGNNRVRKVATNGIISTVAGNGAVPIFPYPLETGDGGPATNATLDGPMGLAIDSQGNLYIADSINRAVRKVDAAGTITLAVSPGPRCAVDNGEATTHGDLWAPWGLAMDDAGNLFIADNGNNRVRKVTNTEGPILALTAVSAASAGNYQLVVTGAGGCVTSSIATLVVATAPMIYRTVHHSDGSVTLNFVSPPGSTNEVLCATNLYAPVCWHSLSTNLAGPDGTWQFTDPNAGNDRAQFYRTRSP